MSILGRVADLFQSKTNRLLAVLEDPNDTLDLTYEKMLTGIQETKRHLADVVAQQISLQRQIGAADREIEGAEADARLAVQAGRDDLARAALVHRQSAIDSRATLQAALDDITPQVEKLRDYESRLEDRVHRFRTQKETMKASYSAAQAQVRAAQAITGVGGALIGAGASLQRAQDKMLGARDKADALDSLIEQGVLGDPLDHRGGADRQLAELRAEHELEGQLALLKAGQPLAIEATTTAPAGLLAPPRGRPETT
jgi:phage shock protein A